MKSTKTLEIYETDTRQHNFEITSPDHEETFEINSYELVDPFKVLNEDGVTRINIENDQYFHIEVTDANDGHAKIGQDNEPPSQEIEIEIPYRNSYNFGELVSEFGVPDTDTAYDTLRYLPTVSVGIVYEHGNRSIEYIEVNGDRYTKE